MIGRKIVVLAVVAFAAMAIVSTASAAVLSENQILRYGSSTGQHGWNASGGDSPHDGANDKALAIVNETGEYVFAYSNRSLKIRKSVTNVKNLGFEFRESSHIGAGAPRITLELQGGDILYLAAYYCNHPMAITGGTWGRSDFTRFKSNCVIWDNNGLSYAADGVNTALGVYALVHPDAVIEQSYFVADEEGRYRVDRLTLGTGFSYVKGNLRAHRCTSETNC